MSDALRRPRPPNSNAFYRTQKHVEFGHSDSIIIIPQIGNRQLHRDKSLVINPLKCIRFIEVKGTELCITFPGSLQNRTILNHILFSTCLHRLLLEKHRMRLSVENQCFSKRFIISNNHILFHIVSLID